MAATRADKTGRRGGAASPPSLFAGIKRLAHRFFLLGLGCLLVGYGLLGPALQLFGTSAIATITDVRRQGGDRGEPIRNRYNYGVGFHFLLADGTRVDGATTVVGNSYSAGIAKGPAPVLYFPFLPQLNALKQQSGFSLASTLLFGVGVLLIRLAVPRHKGTASRRKIKS